MPKSILIAGCGDVGTRLGLRLCTQGHEITAVRRNISVLPQEFHAVSADLSQPNCLDFSSQQFDVVFYTAAAGNYSEEIYQKTYIDGLTNLIKAINQVPHKPQHLFFTSSTAVYDQSDGEWVDETSPTEPTSFSGRIMLQAEQLCVESSILATCIRFGGIYGPNRTTLIKRVLEGAGYQVEPPIYTNRIHVEDCAAILAYLMTVDTPGTLYLGVDNEPASQQEVYTWLATELAAPKPTPIDKAIKQKRRVSSKRCSNQRLLEAGYTFKYPTFREGYEELLKAQSNLK